MRFFGIVIMTLAGVFGVGCASTATRIPASFKPKYNAKIVSSLTTAALNRVLFRVDPAAFRDVSSRQVDRCRTREAPSWSQEFLNFLNVMDRNPELYEKFNVVDFRAGPKADIEITQDIDGLSTLMIYYAKTETTEKVSATTKMPCAESASEYLGRDLVTTNIQWPSSEALYQVLRNARLRANVERFQFNPEFLVFLAERQTVLKINPEVAFERTVDGQYFLTNWLQQMATQIRDPLIEQDYINFWLREIALHSSQAKYIQFFGLQPELNSGAIPSVGVQVDTAGKLTQKMNNYQEASYMFMSYRQQNGAYVYGNITDLNLCLQSLTGVYRNPLSMGTALERDPSSFLAPGHSCQVKEVR